MLNTGSTHHETFSKLVPVDINETILSDLSAYKFCILAYVACSQYNGYKQVCLLHWYIIIKVQKINANIIS